MSDMKRSKRPSNRSSPAMASGWILTKDRHPLEGQRVIAICHGVYHHRVVTFSHDSDGFPHYGSVYESDGKGSLPATHWHPLPELPK